ncbi:unnamed protein product, partial [marine sediment metagenome]
ALQPLRESSFVVSIVFVSFAYILGVFVTTLGRMLIDFLSERFLRHILLQWLVPNIPCDKTRLGINEEYRKKIRDALRSNYDIIKNEVVKRRERGRLVRSALIPGLLGVLAFTVSHPILRFTLLLLVVGAILFLYAYTEVTIYKECQMIEP